MGTTIKNVAKKGLEAYLKGTQDLADKISERLPESMTNPRPRSGGMRGGRRGGASGREGRGGRRTGE